VDGQSVGGWSCSSVVEKLRDAYDEAKREGALPRSS
jgi:hypothetical protein